jgi:hypothetical protein
MDRELRILLDERAITAVMNEYCHAMDTGQHDRWMACFTADAVYDVALPDGRIYARLEGEADFRKFITGYKGPARPQACLCHTDLRRRPGRS